MSSTPEETERALRALPPDVVEGMFRRLGLSAAAPAAAIPVPAAGGPAAHGAGDRAVKVAKRLGDLKAARGPQLNPTPSSASASRVSSLIPTVDDEKTLRGFVPHAKEDAICAAAWVKVQELIADAPTHEDDENTVVHPFMHRVFSAVVEAASAEGIACNKGFHEYSAADSDGRVDWVFTQPHEQRHCALNKCFFVEAKAISTWRTNGKVALTTPVLLRAALAQVMVRLAKRHEDAGEATRHGIGVAFNGVDIVLLRIDFEDDGTDTVYPCFTTQTGKLLVAAPDGSCPQGLRWLVRLMIEHDVTCFGLPRDGDFELPASEPYTFERMLGEGGFGKVSEVRAEGRAFALKSMRFDGAEAKLEHEQRVLEGLKHAAVPRVPVLVKAVTGANGRLGLLMTPVGQPLLARLAAVEDAAARQRLAEAVLAQAYATLVVAHARGFIHGDIRPSNLILVPGAVDEGGAAPDDVYLVDWGLADDAASALVPRKRKELHGVRAFMADEQVRCTDLPPSDMWRPKPAHDLHALLYTYAAIAGHARAEPPWGCGFLGPAATETLIAQRRAWVVANVPAAVVPAALQPEWRKVCGLGE